MRCCELKGPHICSSHEYMCVWRHRLILLRCATFFCGVGARTWDPSPIALLALNPRPSVDRRHPIKTTALLIYETEPNLFFPSDKLKGSFYKRQSAGAGASVPSFSTTLTDSRPSNNSPAVGECLPCWIAIALPIRRKVLVVRRQRCSPCDGPAKLQFKAKWTFSLHNIGLAWRKRSCNVTSAVSNNWDKTSWIVSTPAWSLVNLVGKRLCCFYDLKNMFCSRFKDTNVCVCKLLSTVLMLVLCNTTANSSESSQGRSKTLIMESTWYYCFGLISSLGTAVWNLCVTMWVGLTRLWSVVVERGLVSPLPPCSCRVPTSVERNCLMLSVVGFFRWNS